MICRKREGMFAKDYPFFEIGRFTAILLNHMQASKPIFYCAYMTEKQEFEPWKRWHPQRFSRTSIQLSAVSLIAHNNTNKW